MKIKVPQECGRNVADAIAAEHACGRLLKQFVANIKYSDKQGRIKVLKQPVLAGYAAE